MNKLKKITTWLFTTSLLLIGTSLPASSDTIQDISNFDPQRPGIEFEEGIQGFTYPTFNNFTNNPNILSSKREGDERKFTLAKICPQGTCDPDGVYYNNLVNGVKAGDILRFSIYFHNNGSDPYDGNSNKNSPNAENVKIGVDLFDTGSFLPGEQNVIRPRGFISATNNQYTNSNKNRATDDITTFFLEENLKLTPVENSAKLYVGHQTTGNGDFKGTIATTPQQTTLTYDTFDPDSHTVHAQGKYTDNKLWVEFDEIPGCFVYSGFVYLDVLVEKEEEVVEPEISLNACSSLSFDESFEPKKICQAKPSLTIFKTTVTLDNPEASTPVNQYIEYTVTGDTEGTFFAKEPGDIGLLPKTPQNTSANEVTYRVRINPENVSQGKYSITVMYEGLGQISAKYTDIQGKEILNYELEDNIITKTNLGSNASCQTTIETCGDYCSSMTTKLPTEIPEGSWSVMQANNPKSYHDDLWGSNIKFSVDPGYGEFYMTWAALKEEHPAAFENPNNPEGLFGTPPLAFNQNTNFFQANIFMAALPPFGTPQIPGPLTPSGGFVPTIPTEISYTNINLPAGGENILFFYAEKGGQNVINISAENTETPACNKSLSITGAPVCKSMTVDKQIIAEDGTLRPYGRSTCIQEEEKLLLEIGDIVTDTGILKTSEHEVKVEWKVTEGSGKFLDPDTGNEILVGLGSTTTKTKVIFEGTGSIQARISQIDGEDYINENCIWTFSTTYCQDECKDLKLSFGNGTSKTMVGTALETINIYAESKFGEKYSSKIKWTNPTKGKLEFPNNGLVSETKTTLISAYPRAESATLTNTGKAGVITAEVIGAEEVCNARLIVEPKPPETPEVCANLNAAFKDGTTEMAVGETKQILIESITSNLDKPFSTRVKWLTDTEGTLIFPEAAQETSDGGYLTLYPDVASATLQKPTKAGTLTLEVPTATNVCSQTFTVTKDTPAVCENLGTSILYKDMLSFSLPIRIAKEELAKGNEAVLIRSIVTYSEPKNNITVSYKSAHGCFNKAIKKPELPRAVNNIWFPSTDAAGTLLCDPTLSGVPEKNPVYFIPNKNLEAGTYTNAILIDVENTSVLDCTTTIPMEITEKPVEPLSCKSIELVPTQPDFQTAGTTDGTHIYVDLTNSTTNDYNGKFEFSTNKGTFQNGTSTIELPFTSSTISAAGGILQGADPTPGGTPTVITVKGIDEGGELCTANLTKSKTPVVKTPCKSLDIVQPSGTWKATGGDTPFQIIASPSSSLYTYEWTSSSTGAGQFAKKTTQGTSGLTNTYKFSQVGDTATVKVVGQYASTLCERSIPATGGGGGGTPSTPKITKKVKLTEPREGDFEDTINIPADTDQEVQFKVRVYNLHNTRSLEIEEDEWNNGRIEGSENGDLTYIDESIQIEVGRKTYDFDDIEEDLECDSDEIDSGDFCVENDFEKDGRLGFKNMDSISQIRIFYDMEVDSISEQDCKTMRSKDGCGEEFENKASFTAYRNKDFRTQLKTGNADAKIIVICPYIITRTGGDVFFNTVLKTADSIDIAYCSKLKNFRGVNILSKEKVPYTTADSGTSKEEATQYLQKPSHDICKYSNLKGSPSGLDEYSNPLENFSSVICEMKAEVAEDWQKTNVINQIENNLQKLSIWSKEPNDSTLRSQPADPTGIFKWENKNVTIDSYTKDNTFTIKSEDQYDTPAAQTYVIMNGDLHIKSNIKYQDIDLVTTTLNPKALPSAAFIEINGNIYIDDAVEELWGTYIAVDLKEGASRGQTGQILAEGGTSYNPLRIFGNLVGDVTNLFDNRKYVGNIADDEGSITIKYIENIIVNTPPGLSQLMDVSRLKAVSGN
ncbi:hypothetical protein HOE67_03260 [Candidatus Peregrinibacteria bacterium]|nr:hypothetical protein [Candidatus Peregrinibacteria bacterium]